MKSIAFRFAVGSLLASAVALAQTAPASTPLPATSVSGPTSEDVSHPPLQPQPPLQGPSGSFEDSYSNGSPPHIWSGVKGSFEGIKEADIRTSFESSDSTF